MADFRIRSHPILSLPARQPLNFFWNGANLTAYSGETIAAALIANGIHIFNHHPKDHAPQGVFCANGQCAQCMVMVDGRPEKACITPVQPGQTVWSLDRLPTLPPATMPVSSTNPIERDVPVLILGGGPAGLSAAAELGRRGVPCLLVDDKPNLGGKLVLQTHRFFGSTDLVHAGKRGIDIAARLQEEIAALPSVEVWLQSTALAVFSDQKVGILKNNRAYALVKPQVLLVATGARENFLAFQGNTLPGVFGAGAFQTLVNRDLVLPCQRLFIIGGGNVGLIAGYHALQAGMTVVGLAEALPECGGYRVHKDKLVRSGVPIFTSHTIISANGNEHVESVTIAQVNRNFKIIAGTEKSYPCDAVLIAVGLNPVVEFYKKAQEFGYTTFCAGDAAEIAEASAAMVSGRMKALEICAALGLETDSVPAAWVRMEKILKSKPGENAGHEHPRVLAGVRPVLHCTQEIPCDPCATLCPHGLIYIDPDDIRHTPVYLGSAGDCKACRRCVAGCPGLAITLLDDRKNTAFPRVTIPYEFDREKVLPKDQVQAVDTHGQPLGRFEVKNVTALPAFDHTSLVTIEAPGEIAPRIAGIRLQEISSCEPMAEYVEHVTDDTIVCRCERVTAGEIRALVRQGYRDINELKTVTRVGMGACGAKTCNRLIHRIFREEGVPGEEIADHTLRPLFVEVAIGVFAGNPPNAEDETR